MTFDARFFSQEPAADPRSQIPLSEGKNLPIAGEADHYRAICLNALRNGRCIQCGSDLPQGANPYLRPSEVSGMTRAAFCSDKHFYAFRDRRRYQEDPEKHRERARAYYRRNREKVLEKAAAKRGRPRPPEHTHCTECGDELTGQQRVICGKAGCRDRRFKRLHPEAYAERERQKVERRREARRAAREAPSP